MRQVTYTSSDGRKYEVLIPENAPDTDASKGIVIGPPVLQLDLPDTLSVELHNQLHARGLLTLDDVRHHRQEVYNALMRVLALDVDIIMAQYQLDGSK